MFLITIEWVHTLTPTIVGVSTTKELADKYIETKTKAGGPEPLGVYIATEVKLLDTEATNE